MSPLLLALVLGVDASPAPAPQTPPPTTVATPTSVAPAPEEPAHERLLASQVGASLGVLGSGIQVHGTRWGDTLLAPAVTARGVIAGVLVEGAVLGTFPLTSGGAATALTGLGRVGYVGQRFSVHVGATAQWAGGAPAEKDKQVIQVLPSLRAEVSFGLAGLSLGVFDFMGQVPLHLSAEVPTRYGHFSLGYVAPLGAVATADLPLTGTLGLRAQAWAWQLVNSQQGFFTLGLTWGAAR